MLQQATVCGMLLLRYVIDPDTAVSQLSLTDSIFRGYGSDHNVKGGDYRGGRDGDDGCLTTTVSSAVLLTTPSHVHTVSNNYCSIRLHV